MSFADVAQSRHVAARAATLTLSGTDEDGETADPGTVTVTVTNSAGETVTAGAVAASGSDRATTIAPADTPTVDRLKAVWSSDGVAIDTTYHDIVGGVYCTVPEIRTDTALANNLKHDAAALIVDRTEVEYQIESACDRAFVPRFWSETVDGTGDDMLTLTKPDLREIVWANYWNGSAWVPVTFDVTEIPEHVTGHAMLRNDCWPHGTKNIRVGYRYGWDRPPPDMRRAAIKAVQHFRTGEMSGIPDRAISVQGTDLGNVVLATPGLGKWITAVPGIDEVLNRYKFRRVLVA